MAPAPASTRVLWALILVGGLAMFIGGAGPWVGYSIAVPSKIAAGYGAAGIFHWSGLLAFSLGLICWIVAIVGLVNPLGRGRRLVVPVVALAATAAAGAAYVLARWPQILSEEEGARSGARLLGYGTDVVGFLQEGPASGIAMEAGPGVGLWMVLGGAAMVLGAAIALLIRTRSAESGREVLR